MSKNRNIAKLSSKIISAINNGSHLRYKDNDEDDDDDDNDSDYSPKNQLTHKSSALSSLKMKVKRRKSKDKVKNLTLKRKYDDIDQKPIMNSLDHEQLLNSDVIINDDNNNNNDKSASSGPSPPISPIKIKKRFKSKRKLNWAIVSDDDNDDDDGIGIKKKKRKKTKGKKVTFNVAQMSDPNDESKQQTDDNGKGKKKTRKYTKRQSPSSSIVKNADNGIIGDNKAKNKPIGAYSFSCLTKPFDDDFEQPLPNEILVRIFNQTLDMEKDQRMRTLINLSQVCEYWRKLIISTPLLWQHLDLHDFPDDKSESCGLYDLCDNHLFDFVCELNLSGWCGLNAERVLTRIALRANDNLKVISLKHCKYISSNFLQIISSHCHTLESLDISGITNGTHTANTSAFAAAAWRPFLETCGNTLLALYMAENSVPTFFNCISAIMDYCPNLQILDISNVESVNKSATISIEKLQNSCPKLKVLRAANITLTTSSVHSSSGFAHLEELSIPSSDSGITGVIATAHTDAVIEQLTKSAEKLKLIDIRGARLLTPRALVKIPSWSVQYLVITNCPMLYSDQLALAFSKWCSSLVDIDLSWNISEKSVVSCLKELCESGEDSQLRSIQLRGSAVPFDDLKRLLVSCRKLESIDLQSCRGLPRGIKRSYTGTEFITLRDEIIEGRYD